MAKLVCSQCNSQRDVPHVHDGPGVPSKKEEGKLVCPAHGDTCMPTPIPQCCGRPMTYKP